MPLFQCSFCWIYRRQSQNLYHVYQLAGMQMLTENRNVLPTILCYYIAVAYYTLHDMAQLQGAIDYMYLMLNILERIRET